MGYIELMGPPRPHPQVVEAMNIVVATESEYIYQLSTHNSTPGGYVVRVLMVIKTSTCQDAYV